MMAHDVDKTRSSIVEPHVVILHEADMHPHSYLLRLEESFEKPSIVHVVGNDGLRKYNTPPVYNDKYLVLFDSVKILEANYTNIRLSFMLPVICCATLKAVEDARALCKDKELPFRVYENKFVKADAVELIHQLASVKVTAEFTNVLIKRVGLSPRRIVSAIMACEQFGFTPSNVSKYIDKYIYLDSQDVIESLLGICKSMAQQRRAATYLSINRHWYNKFTRKNLVTEVSGLIAIFSSLIDGTLTSFTVREYCEANRVSRYRVMYALDLYEKVSLNELQVLERFLMSASLLEVSLHLM